MKYRAIFSIDFDAFDQPELRQRKQEFAEWLVALERGFGPTVLTVKERRPRLGPRARAPLDVWDGQVRSGEPVEDV
ncbi:hypothetical protein GCM10009422_26020 [Brevundimonas kwangchunensis]|uniref:Uncharacterized protein n=1 Tax=Brevundimonas kwangchunensis TaxID=322163 RepID=A0ABN1H358_9CAUL